MTPIIKIGTVVTSDLTCKADVRLDNGMITETGPRPKHRMVQEVMG